MTNKIKTEEQLNLALNDLFKTELYNYNYTFSNMLPIGNVNNKDLQVKFYTESGYCLEKINFDFDYWNKHGEFPYKELFNTQDPQEMYNEILKRKEAQGDK